MHKHVYVRELPADMAGAHEKYKLFLYADVLLTLSAVRSRPALRPTFFAASLLPPLDDVFCRQISFGIQSVNELLDCPLAYAVLHELNSA